MRLTSLIICVCAAPLLIAASEPVRLQPSSPWVVDYAENSCRLIRTFGEGNALTKLVFESSTPADMDMLVIGKPLDTSAATVPARFLPTGRKSYDGNIENTVTGDPAIIWPGVEMLPDQAVAAIKAEDEDLRKHPGVRPPGHSVAEQQALKALRQDFAASTTELEIDSHHNRPVMLETGAMGDAIKAYDKCNEDSLRDWGVDPKLEAQIVRPVFALNPANWISSEDYPRDMVAAGKESQVVVRLLIDAAGRITRCTAISHFNEAEFNRITCDLVTKRAKFQPAELADGTKVPSYYAQRVIFRLWP